MKDAIQKAYSQNWDAKGPNIDQINNMVAPYIKTPEEAYYVATIIVSDVIGTMNQQGMKFHNPDLN